MDLQPWQLDILNRMAKYKGRGIVQITGRQSGKSILAGHAFQRLWADIHSQPLEDIKLSEGTVYGSRYYTAEPVGGKWIEMESWCLTTFGNSGSHMWGEKAPEPAERWYMNNRKFWFRDEKDRMVFVLKWR